MKHSTEDIKRLLAEADEEGIPVFNPHAIIRDLLAEVERLQKLTTAQVESRNLLMDSHEAEVARLKSLAASRLADQESIEKHTARVCADIVDAWNPECNTASPADLIRKRYGVES